MTPTELDNEAKSFIRKQVVYARKRGEGYAGTVARILAAELLRPFVVDLARTRMVLSGSINARFLEPEHYALEGEVVALSRDMIFVQDILAEGRYIKPPWPSYFYASRDLQPGPAVGRLKTAPGAVHRILTYQPAAGPTRVALDHIDAHLIQAAETLAQLYGDLDPALGEAEKRESSCSTS